MTAARGRFFTFEGIDGSGKSTQARRLAAALEAEGHEAILTREPGGAPGAEAIRELVLTGEPDRWSPETEILLFTAARRDHLERLIRPSLEAGKLVLCDRFADSTRVYQGLTRGDLTKTVDALHELMIGLEPDVTFLLDADPETSLRRGLTRGGELRFEGFGLDMQERARAGFLALAAAAPARFRVIDANRSEEEIAADILAAAKEAL
ncbi:dTMP kinase [Pseudoroseicyclus sp. CXY001]|uniref:dTMP kinase n=1 Tax=Pseudoroseicyclus sp. CXY001 TaxID=3242492 RepID=UPI00358DB6A2